MNKKTIAITQILVLIIGIMAISYAVGTSVGIVSADGSGPVCGDGNKDAGETCVSCPTDVKCIGKICDPVLEECVDKNDGKDTVTYSLKNEETGQEINIPIPKEDLDEDGFLNEKGKKTILDRVRNVLGTGSEAYGAWNLYDNTKNKIAALKNSEDGFKLTKLFKGTGKLRQFLFGKKGSRFFTKIGSEGTFYGRVIGPILGKVAVAFTVAQLLTSLAKALGAGERNLKGIKRAAYLSAGGTSVFVTIAVIANVNPAAWLVASIVILATGIYALFTFQNYSQEVFTYVANVWQPPEKGKDCEKCNDLRYGCSEYQCRSFGEACEIINKGEEDKKCISSIDNGKPPTIAPLASALPEGYEYRDSNAVLPPERGVKIFYKGHQDGCVPPFTSVVLGVETNEPAECKIDLERKQFFDDMVSYLSEGSANVYNHTLTLPAASTPSTGAIEDLGGDIKNGKQHEFYIRCKDPHGNVAPMNFVLEFCVDDGPDIDSPEILGTNYLQESYIKYNQSSVPLEVYTNEPADCKWDFEDKAYDQMSREMDFCSQSTNDYIDLSSFSYGCSGTLEGVKDNVENKYYIRCKDKPWLEGQTDAKGKRYENRESYPLTLKGTRQLIINSITVNGGGNDTIIKDSVDPVKVTLEVETSAGADDGRARCQYKTNDKYYYFYNGGILDYSLYKNTQRLDLSGGNYVISIKCNDLGGNTDTGIINFSVEIDTEAPIIVRAYYENSYLKIITDEEAECRYGTSDNVGCDYNYEEGNLMLDVEGLEHYVDWNSNTNFYIKCGEDKEGGIYPPKNQCSMVVRPFNIYS